MNICSNDAVKVLKEFPEADPFSIEQALYATSPKVLVLNIKNQKGKDIAHRVEIIRAKCACGYAKNIDREMPPLAWESFKEHYGYLTTYYLKKSFSYRDLEAIQDISTFNFPYIGEVIKRIKVQNLWYLRKVLFSEFEADIRDKGIFKRQADVYIEPISNKGAKIIIDESLKQYAE